MAAHPDASAKFWGVMRGYKFRPDAAESLADGLRKAGVPIGPPTDSDPNAEANAACLEIGDLGGPSVLVPVATDRLEYRAKC
jgi:hypothetical protein